MGPTVLFDKSFIQSISLDESVWFSHFFNPIICPLFYVETLADLAKEPKNGISPEDIVKRIALKFPETSGAPCVFHLDLALGNLLGENIPKRKGIPVRGGELVQHQGKTGVVYQVPPESDAFNRWVRGDFYGVEKQYAKNWRNQLANLDLNSFSDELNKLKINTKSCKNHTQAKAIAESIINGKDKIFERMHLICLLLRIPDQFMHQILYRWNSVGNIPVARYAPYASYVATIELFFHILIASKLESGNRNSHLIDISYLHYLPFCDFFVSSDKLHARCSPLFLEGEQQFIQGKKLKEDLKKIDEYYDQLSSIEKEKGIFSFAKHPPKEKSFLVSEIWDKYFHSWRINKKINPEKLDPNIVDEITSITNSKPIPRENANFDPQDPDTLTIHRSIRKKKGKWYQLPKDFDPKKKS